MNSSLQAERFSARLADLEASPIREILSVIDRPGMISFAGGLPAAESFPAVDLSALPPSMLQYGASEGEMALRRQVAEDVGALGLACTPEQVLILSGSQQGIDLVGKLFIDRGTPVAVEAPTYLAALQAFRFYGASFTTLDRTRPGFGLAGSDKPAFAYAIPTFQNPTGHCYSEAEREALATACDATGVPLFEDDPYRDLAYDDCARTPVCARIKKASWVYQGSFSKSFAPGLRLGYLVASSDLIPYLTRLKQAADLHSNRVSQWLVLGFLQDAGRAQRIARIVELYRARRDAFARALAKHFQGLATWQLPPGGLFFWVELASRIDTRTLLPRAIERGVAFMPGENFYAGRPDACGALRLNFSHASEEMIDRGLAILAGLIRQAD
jgi:DNA-binding transcriptional MocR family regulator